DRHRSVRLVILVGLAIDQIAQSGLSSLYVIYYLEQLFSRHRSINNFIVNLLSGLVAYCLMDKKPNLSISTSAPVLTA
ncbi:TPA: hypothetical protein ACWV46_005348, partial [Salmonella enterica subsp. enterica serovar Muenchen]